MRVVAAIALTAAILIAGASPTVAFDTQDFASHAVAWQTKSRAIVNDMRPNPASINRSLNRLAASVERYTDWLYEAVPDQCQREHGFGQHRYFVRMYYQNVIGAMVAMPNTLVASRYVKRFVYYYKQADNAGSRVLEACW
jgi:hypothetical protein